MPTGDENEFGRRLQAAREHAKKTQAEVAREGGVSRSAIANYERAKGAPDPLVAVELARVLNASEEEFLLGSILQRSADPDASGASAAQVEALAVVVRRLLDSVRGVPPKPASPAGALTLMDFPRGFLPLTVVVGDKREDEPKNPADLFVFSASTVDDRWLMDLGLRSGTEKLSDKVLMTAGERWLRERFGRTHILCIGSPASNLFTRDYNDCFLFRFALSRETVIKWRDKRGDLKGRVTPHELLAFRESSKNDLKQMMRLFKQPGFVNFNYQNLKVGIDPAENRDFAVVSLGRNPFAQPGDGYFAILAAGVHHPGTAHAVKKLASPFEFEKHPYGGVLEVQVPRDKLRSVDWHDKIKMSHAEWHRVGQGALEYEPQQLLASLTVWLDKLSRNEIITDVELTPDELKGHIQLVQALSGLTPPNQSKAAPAPVVDQ